MAIYVHVATACEVEARSHGQTQLIESLRESIHDTQTLTGFDFFRPTPLIKKSLGHSFRLIGFRAPKKDDEVILFLRVLARGSNDYEFFLRKWKDDTDAVLQKFQPYGPKEIDGIHADLSRSSSPPRLPSADEHERRWLYEVFRTDDSSGELLVLETATWVQQMQARQNLPLLGLYHQTLDRLLDHHYDDELCGRRPRLRRQRACGHTAVAQRRNARARCRNSPAPGVLPESTLCGRESSKGSADRRGFRYGQQQVLAIRDRSSCA